MAKAKIPVATRLNGSAATRAARVSHNEEAPGGYPSSGRGNGGSTGDHCIARRGHCGRESSRQLDAARREFGTIINHPDFQGGAPMRRVVLGALFALGAVTMTVRAAQQPAGQPAPMVVEVDKLRDNFYIMRGGGGNSGVFITATGVVVV